MAAGSGSQRDQAQDLQENMCSLWGTSRLSSLFNNVLFPSLTPRTLHNTYLNCGEPDVEAIDARAESPGSCGREAL
jgi:hypothetical protein